jgi:hypothetical protein
MKKKIIYAISVLIILGCSSCQKKETQIVMPVQVWDGQNFHLTTEGFPLSIIWLMGKIPHKGFCQAQEIKEIIERLMNPEIAEAHSEQLLAMETQNRLCLFYYRGGKYVSRVATVKFNIDKEGVFLGPLGKSPALGKLLQEKEESGMSRYALYGVPNEIYTEEMIDRRIESDRYVQDYQRRYEEAAARYEILGVTKPFELVDITIDELLNRSIGSFDGILIRRSDDSDPNHVMALAGELRSVQPIVGHKINADKILGYPWPIRIFEGFQKAEKVRLTTGKEVNEYEVIFLDGGDNRKGYRIKVAMDKKYVYGVDYRSKQLRKCFTEMGLFETK